MNVGVLVWVAVLFGAALIVGLCRSQPGRWVLVGFAIAGLVATLTGCATKPDVIVDTRPPATVVVTRYVRIDPALTAPTPIATGTVDQAIEVAAARKVQLIQCNAALEAIRSIQGSKAPC